MKTHILIALIALSAAGAHAQPPQRSDAECGVDLGRFMNMTFAQFDQDLDHGWREIADKPGCERAGADLIALYRDEQLAQQMAGLDWHEAQVRAGAGETTRAIELFRRNLEFRKKRAMADQGSAADVLYAEATIAFLERDRAALIAKRAQLAALPKPDWFDEAAEKFRRAYPGSKALMVWPSNLDTVDGFIACFDRPYAEAYALACRPQGAPKAN